MRAVGVVARRRVDGGERSARLFEWRTSTGQVGVCADSRVGVCVCALMTVNAFFFWRPQLDGVLVRHRVCLSLSRIELTFDRR